MKSAFNQIPLHIADRHKTAFSTPDGDKYEFNRLCFGLKNSPKAFQSIAQEVLGDLLHNGALVYIHDIILFTKTIDEHFELLGKVFERFERIHLKFNPSKCQFLTKSCKFLGFVVTPEGILIDKDKSVSINEFPVPTDQKQIKSFLGCCNFYRRYIKNFAKRALPLTNLLRKDTPFEWTSETQEAFDDIKKATLNPPVLALPDPDTELQITTDASSRGIGAVLEQKYPNSEVKPLYFFSKKLNPSQSKYNATVLEFFAIYTALNFFRPFLLGRKFKVFTDHKSLAGFLSNKNPSSKILRWKLALEEFNYDIHYIRGSLNSVADHLSRCISNITIALPDSKDLIKMQHEDPVLSPIIQKIDQNDVSPQVSNYFINGEGLLCHLSKRPSRSPRSNTTRKQVCIPHCLKARILESVHSEYGGHLKFFKTYHRLSENFFWQNMYKDTKNFVRSCTVCLSRKRFQNSTSTSSASRTKSRTGRNVSY
ncbi:retrovirus-related Pol polyprotein from transposon 17.6 [Trichonephila clavipes]|nr:retrovirus-related Pol polyprotein from transposon 17.6 [Trichonephila clavipes]